MDWLKFEYWRIKLVGTREMSVLLWFGILSFISNLFLGLSIFFVLAFSMCYIVLWSFNLIRTFKAWWDGEESPYEKEYNDILRERETRGL